MSWYPDEGPLPVGYWGPITSTLLWCERKYVWSYYVAEPVNTFTNFMFMGLALYGMYLVHRERLPSRFIACYACLGIVGFGSFLFHMTLKHETQLGDELPMIWGGGVVTYSFLEHAPGYNRPRGSFLLPVGIFAVIAWITVTYVMNGNPVFHQVAYGSIFAYTSIRAIIKLCHPDSELAQTPESREIRGHARRAQLIGVLTFLLGFLLWNIDNVFCPQLHAARDAVGYPLAILLEGHGWWHIFTCYGTFYLIVTAELMVVALKEHPGNIRIHYDVIPWVERARDFDPNHTLVGEIEAAKRK